MRSNAGPNDEERGQPSVPMRPSLARSSSSVVRRRAQVELSEGLFSPQMDADGRRFFSCIWRVWRAESMRSHPGTVTGRHSVLAEGEGP